MAKGLPTDTSFDVAKGLPSIGLELHGDGGAPDVTLHGPDGEEYTTGGQLSLPEKPFLFLRDDESSIAYVAVDKPTAGKWTVTANEGSAPMTSVEIAQGLDKPSIKASVSGDGAKRTIDYEMEPQPGVTFTFAEEGDGVYSEIGDAKEAKGHLTFKPVNEVGGKRKIVAIVSRDGVPTETLDVATFQAPPPPKMTPPQGLRAQHKGEKVLVRFKPVAGADSYSVTLATSDGYSQLEIAQKPKAIFPDVSPVLKGKVSVASVAGNGDAGNPAKARLKRAR
jgi:hypothetical protein